MPSDTHDIDFQGSFFSLEIDDTAVAWFTGCSGLSMEFDVTEFKEINKDGKNVTRKRPGRPKYSEVVLKRGFTTDMKLHQWFDTVIQAADPTPYKTGAIVIYDRNHKEGARFTFEQIWPSKLSVSDLSAGSDDVMIEELTIQHEFLDWVG